MLLQLARVLVVATSPLVGSAHATEQTAAGTTPLVENKIPEDESKSRIVFLSNDSSIVARPRSAPAAG
jgi:hypothetical protein